ncbi:histone modifying enzyme [Lithospermum erythrorhizon]|uniref:Histone modifying enzyme n=1 Tax=Lithospermum erythrorhizon TaxID=34254 RepID=A0AAV3P0R8_LITER
MENVGGALSKHGEVIITQQPYVSVPNKTEKCNYCFASNNIKTCSNCKFLYYCSTICQKVDWKLHKEECKVLSRMDTNSLKSLTASIRLMLKLYLKNKLQQQKVIPTTATDNYNLVKALVSHILLCFFLSL